MRVYYNEQINQFFLMERGQMYFYDDQDQLYLVGNYVTDILMFANSTYIGRL